MWILLTGPSDEKNPYADKVRDAYHNYMGLATLAANKILHNLDDARDAAMQAFVRVLEHPEKVFDGRSDEHIKNYIVMIARNTALNMAKRNVVIPISSFDKEDYANSSPTSEMPISSKVEAKALASNIIKLLSDTERRIMALQIIYGESIQEIADDLQKTSWAIRKQRSRAIQRAKDYCIRHNIDPLEYI